MSRALHTRLVKLEARKAPLRGVVIIPWRDWPAEGDQTAWERLKAQHPHGQVFLPSQMTADEWESSSLWDRVPS